MEPVLSPLKPSTTNTAVLEAPQTQNISQADSLTQLIDLYQKNGSPENQAKILKFLESQKDNFDDLLQPYTQLISSLQSQKSIPTKVNFLSQIKIILKKQITEQIDKASLLDETKTLKHFSTYEQNKFKDKSFYFIARDFDQETANHFIKTISYLKNQPTAEQTLQATFLYIQLMTDFVLNNKALFSMQWFHFKKGDCSEHMVFYYSVLNAREEQGLLPQTFHMKFFTDVLVAKSKIEPLFKDHETEIEQYFTVHKSGMLRFKDDFVAKWLPKMEDPQKKSELLKIYQVAENAGSEGHLFGMLQDAQNFYFYDGEKVVKSKTFKDGMKLFWPYQVNSIMTVKPSQLYLNHDYDELEKITPEIVPFR